MLTVSGVSSTSSEIILKINQIPLNGSCLVNLKNGTSLETNFTVTCSNWFDADGNITSYEFYGDKE